MPRPAERRKALRFSALRASEDFQDTISAEMDRPAAQNAKLNSLLDELYRPGAKVGSGSTASAVREELATGRPVGGRFHSQKARDYVIALRRWLADNRHASAGDRAAAESVIEDLENALSGKQICQPTKVFNVLLL